MQTWFSTSGRVSSVIKNGESVSLFLLRSRRRVKVPCRILDVALPAEYVNQVVQLGARVCVAGEVRGSFLHVRCLCTPPPGLRERARLALNLFAVGFFAGLSLNVPGFEGVDARGLCRAWVERQRERWSNVRRFLNGKR